MPDITLDTPTGTVVFNYTISTPTQTSASHIDPALPTILFLHPVYLGKVIFHQQFEDRELRRFNLIGLDLRCHGRTQGKAGKGYGREVAARDVELFMSSLQIPKYHLFGMSMGGCIALQTGILFPSAVLSIFIVSSLPLTEPTDVGEGRQEIYRYWAQGVTCNETHTPGSSLSDAITGCFQLSVNNHPSKVFNAIVRASFPFMMQQWGIDQLDDFHAASVEFFTLREAYTVEAMRNISCPVYMVHCSADIAYDVSTTNKVADHLRTAGVSVEVTEIPGAAHFGSTTHPTEVNDLLHRFILSVCPQPPPPIPETVESPFREELVTVGWDSDSESDDPESTRHKFI
ncbi:Alpha/Beta hydrolase protein [Mycena metata]|uniref:Alpha/Beta hydrolase protein n=1 Tax=Mycena metata TaxID=1033252 RepID=A0AAD7K1L5_9AGAR|nr:Alpha/Beta hydrolase protein [Mycena metata]